MMVIDIHVHYVIGIISDSYAGSMELENAGSALPVQLELIQHMDLVTTN